MTFSGNTYFKDFSNDVLLVSEEDVVIGSGGRRGRSSGLVGPTSKPQNGRPSQPPPHKTLSLPFLSPLTGLQSSNLRYGFHPIKKQFIPFLFQIPGSLFFRVMMLMYFYTLCSLTFKRLPGSLKHFGFI
ncbi:MAG: hypothetical protein K2W94_07060 [Alphaproteobacteria bacterium]|nr:hypothetical protein [Alphaproteobacteria bacterium]